MKNKIKKNLNIIFNVIVVCFTILAVILSQMDSIAVTAFNNNEKVIRNVEIIFENRNKAIIDGDLDLIKSMYDTSTRYGRWAYEYEQRKVKYINNWQKKQGIKFISITPTVVVRRVRDKGTKHSLNLICSNEYEYVYENQPDVINSCKIGTYHVLDVVNSNDSWIITKEWYKDPFADSLNLDKIDSNAIKEYILSKDYRSLDGLTERRMNAVEYADRYCGAASELEFSFKYNTKYRDYNPKGGDCANFASQVLYEGGKFKKTSSWNYDSRGATRAWVNADGFKAYMINSGRASVIAYGSYEKVYKASYKLLPGDFIAYEQKGDINHISVVTGADSKGYSLVSCHNTDRSNVPWDLGWSNSKTRFWLVRVHY